MLNKGEFNTNKTFLGPSHGTVTCSTSWHTADVEVTLISTFDSSRRKGEYIADCLYNATVTQYFDLSYGEEELFICNVTHGGKISVDHRRVRVKQEGQYFIA